MKPIRIEHGNAQADDQLNVEISLGNSCNYACSYCPDNLHDGTHGWIEIEHVYSFLKAVDQQRSGTKLVQYTGGEPTTYPSFEKLLQFGRERGFIQSVISNGSRTLRFWERYSDYFDKIHLTFHQEFADINHFYKVIQIASDSARVHVNFTMIPELFDEIVSCADTIADLNNTTITLKPLRIGFGSELYPYTDDQLGRMKRFKNRGSLRESADLRGMMRVVYDDDSEILKRPSGFLIDGDNSWKNWKCYIGMQSLIVKPNGNIYRGVCRVGGVLGNIRDQYELPDQAVQCTKNVCACPSDIMIRKTLHA